MSFLSRVLDATISPESKAANVEDKLEAVSIVSSVVEPLPQAAFRRLLSQERKRSERSRKSFLLMLVRHKGPKLQAEQPSLERVVRPLGTIIRETDTLGWFESNLTLGVIFNELGDAELGAAVKSIESKALLALQHALNTNHVENLEISIYSYPQSWKDGGVTITFDPVLYPDLFDLDESKKTSLLLKRLIDIVGSVVALILLAPIFAILAALVKLTSKGPVFFRQQRLGQFQVPFAFLKFRSMYVTTDTGIHREYVKNFIAGRAEPNSTGGQQRRVYKLTNDPRVTWIGRFMRRTSLDEIPQFWNVLVGQMSLVGPRPHALAHDNHFENLLQDYAFRHHVKPGMSGWAQVNGLRGATPSVEQIARRVEMDLWYINNWSLWLDVQILIKTLFEVLRKRNAF